MRPLVVLLGLCFAASAAVMIVFAQCASGEPSAAALAIGLAVGTGLGTAPRARVAVRPVADGLALTLFVVLPLSMRSPSILRQAWSVPGWPAALWSAAGAVVAFWIAGGLDAAWRRR